MANDTIQSGGTFTLTQPLTGGTNIDFLNNAGASGVLNLTAAALQVTTLVSNGATSVIGDSIGGTIENFQPGDLITLQNLASFYNELDFAPNAAAENASFANDLTFAAANDLHVFIDPDGSVTTSVQTPFTFDSNSVMILDEIRDGLFGTAGTDATLTLALATRSNPNSNHPFIDGVISTDTAMNPCFAAGTQILTADGEVPVEALRAGQRIITLHGEEREVVWVGSREVDIARHKRPETVQPIIIEPGALADSVPSRRLVVSPDHALFLDGWLVPAKDLVNRGSIRQNTAAQRIRYYHVELTAHDVLFADGAAAESFLDTGHRALFDNNSGPVPLHPEMMQRRREAESCAPLCLDGNALAAVRRRLAERQAGPARQAG